VRRNGPNILSHLALGDDCPHLSIDDNYVADFAISNRGARLCKVILGVRTEPIARLKPPTLPNPTMEVERLLGLAQDQPEQR
jgi:hypothetical protein